jgi:hypothetical protein
VDYRVLLYVTLSILCVSTAALHVEQSAKILRRTWCVETVESERDIPDTLQEGGVTASVDEICLDIFARFDVLYRQELAESKAKRKTPSRADIYANFAKTWSKLQIMSRQNRAAIILPPVCGYYYQTRQELLQHLRALLASADRLCTRQREVDLLALSNIWPLPKGRVMFYCWCCWQVTVSKLKADQEQEMVAELLLGWEVLSDDSVFGLSSPHCDRSHPKTNTSLLGVGGYLGKTVGDNTRENWLLYRSTAVVAPCEHRRNTVLMVADVRVRTDRSASQCCTAGIADVDHNGE